MTLCRKIPLQGTLSSASLSHCTYSPHSTAKWPRVAALNSLCALKRARVPPDPEPTCWWPQGQWASMDSKASASVCWVCAYTSECICVYEGACVCLCETYPHVCSVNVFNRLHAYGCMYFATGGRCHGMHRRGRFLNEALPSNQAKLASHFYLRHTFICNTLLFASHLPQLELPKVHMLG